MNHDAPLTPGELELLRQDLERFRATLENALDAVVTMSAEGSVTGWNAQAERIFGWKREEVMGKKMSEVLIPPNYRRAHEDGLKRFLASGQARMTNQRVETTGLHRDGREIPIELAVIPVRIAQGISFSAFIRDLTAVKQSQRAMATLEEQLRLSEQRFSKAFRASPLGILFSTLEDGRVIDANDAFLKIFGYSRQEVIGRTSAELGMWADPEDRPRLLRQLLKHGAIHNVESAFRMKSGELRRALASVEIVELSGERCALILFNDISERRRLEEQLRQFQKMESIGQLAAGVAHDFNNILAVIQGHADMLLSGMVDGSDVEESLKQIAGAARRGGNLTRQLLAFSRKQEMQPQDLNLNEVVGGMTKMLGRLLGANVALQFVPAPGLPAVHGDVGMIEQVLLNLAVNARDAMPRGGKLVVTTAVRTTGDTQMERNPEARAGQFVRLSVSDTGCGIAPEVLPRIFEPFFTTKEVGKGTGLGLATVYGIVKQHQGWIEVESEAGRGTTFNVFLPAGSRTTGPLSAPVPSRAARGHGETILIAEDEPALRRLAARVLRDLGYEVLEAGSGAEAIQVWEQQTRKVDLLLTDLVMPDGFTGRELAKKLEARQTGLKVIYTSGYSPEMGETVFVFREGINFLQKPYQPQTLAKAVRDCLDA
jgi:two-component system, cell cycle sensor histidine kinase and response regulator CckA